MNLPSFITFTGADDRTDVDSMAELARDYPIEWGILLSPKRHGTPRYPTLDWLERLTAYGRRPLRLSAHLCGGYSRKIIDFSQSALGAYGWVQWCDDDVASVRIARQLSYFLRVQINTTQTVDSEKISRWARMQCLKPILQTRANLLFPSDSNVAWLFDQSGGEGVMPREYPQPPYPPNQQRVDEYGYAGGITPANVLEVLGRIPRDTRSFWIDMESGVRTDDQFDLSKCRAVCEAVYGEPRKQAAA